MGSNEKLFQSQVNCIHFIILNFFKFFSRFSFQISQNAVVIYSKSSCGYCTKARNLLDSEGIKYLSLDLDRTEGGMDLFKTVNAVTSSRFVPQIFICSQYIGGNGKFFSKMLQKI